MITSIGERIKFIRKQYKLTQTEFGKKFGVSQTHISKIEKGEENPSETLIMFICSSFFVNYEWLKNGTGLIEPVPNSSEDINYQKSKRALVEIENNMDKWGSDVAWNYANSLEAFSYVLSLYKPESQATLNYGAQISYFSYIFQIINRIQFIVMHDGEIHQDMTEEDINAILVHQNKMIRQISKLLHNLSKSIFDIHDLDSNKIFDDEDE